MELLKIIEDLISIKTVTGQIEEINRCLEYIKDVLAPSGAITDIIKNEHASPVIFSRNTDTSHFDVLILGHIDVVPAKDEMFTPRIVDGKLYARGALDMKSFAAVAIQSMQYVMANKLNLKFGFILSTDEEQGSASLEAFLEKHPNLTADIVLDNDVGGDICHIITKCKNPVYVRLHAKGQAAHGSTPWEGIDANEQLFLTWRNIRQLYPAYDLNTKAPQNTWIDTVHMATVEGGKVSNIISSEATALLDFRLTESSTLEGLKHNLQQCMTPFVTFEIEMSSIPVVTDENNPIIADYKVLAEKITGQPIKFEHMGGATDSRALYARGALVIMHSGTGEGMHADGEYVVLKSVEQIARIQTEFLTLLASKK